MARPSVAPGGWLVPPVRAIAATGMVGGKQVDLAPRCSACGRRLAEYAAAPYAFKCPRCKAEVKRG